MNFFKNYKPKGGKEGDVVRTIHAVYKSFSEHVMDAARRGSLTVSFFLLPNLQLYNLNNDFSLSS